MYMIGYNPLWRSGMFDAQCDFAALVYGEEDRPDSLLVDFARDLRRSGFHPAGIIQLGRNCQLIDRRLDVVVFPRDEVVAVIHVPACKSTGCRLDTRHLASVATEIATAVQKDADLVIINRFGKLEAEGQGLIALIKQAVSAEVPVLAAVPVRHFAKLLKFSAGMNVRLPCCRPALDRWWCSVARGPAMRKYASTFCEIAK